MKNKNWVKKFDVVGIVPGKIVFLGVILDLSDPNLPIERVQEAFDLGCRCLKLKDAEDPIPESISDTDASNPKNVKQIMEKLDQDGKKKSKKAKKENPS
jgi:hypothetical protein